MGNNKITIVINTFKSEDKINQCLDSISQEFKVIVVENSKNTNFKNQIEQNYSNVECILAKESENITGCCFLLPKEIDGEKIYWLFNLYSEDKQGSGILILKYIYK